MLSDCWTSVHADNIRINQWNGEYVLYNVNSGDTHLLDKTGVAILEFLQGCKATSDDIYKFLQKQKPISLSYEQLQEFLEGMSRINLIDKVL